MKLSINCKQILSKTPDMRKYTLNLNQFAKYRDHFYTSSGYIKYLAVAKMWNVLLNKKMTQIFWKIY